LKPGAQLAALRRREIKHCPCGAVFEALVGAGNTCKRCLARQRAAAWRARHKAGVE